MFTRYLVALDPGVELTVASQNLDTTSRSALAAKGQRVRLVWDSAHVHRIGSP
jgi:hypothetical protein